MCPPSSWGRERHGLATYTWSIDGNIGSEVDVELLVDFLIAQSGALPWEEANVHDYVYDPSQNHPSLKTTAGLLGPLWPEDNNVSQVIFDEKYPVAHSNKIRVPCGQG
jgi:hypothetical protein